MQRTRSKTSEESPVSPIRPEIKRTEMVSPGSVSQRELKRMRESELTTVKPAQFLLAAQQGDLKTVQDYINERGGDDVFDMNVILEDSSTALILAARAGHAEIVDALLNAPGTDVNAKDYSNETAFNYAAYAGNIRIAINILAADYATDNLIDVLKIVKENGHLRMLDIIKKSFKRKLAIADLVSGVNCNITRATISEILILSDKKYVLFMELAHYEKMANHAGQHFPLTALARVQDKIPKMPEAVLEERKVKMGMSNSVHYCLKFMAGNQPKEVVISTYEMENTQYRRVIKVTLTSGEEYAIKWVSKEKDARREAKFINAVSDHPVALWFRSAIKSKQYGTPYPWKAGDDLKKISNEKLLSFSLLTRLNMLIMILRILNKLHAHLYAHNDLNLANIIIGPDGTASIIDYALTARMDIKIGFNEDLNKLSRIINKLFLDLHTGADNIKSAIKMLLSSLTHPKQQPCTSEQALQFCVLVRDSHYELSNEKLQQFAAETIQRQYLTTEDVYRGRYLNQ